METLSSPSLSNLQELRDATYRLLKYVVSTASPKIDNALIQSVSPLLQKELTQFSSEEIQQLWTNYHALSVAAYPATNESLWLKEHIDRDDRAQAEGDLENSSPIAQAYKKTYLSFKRIGYFLGILFFFLQVYTVMLADSVEQVNQYYAEIAKLETQIFNTQQAMPDAKPCDAPLRELNSEEDQLMLKIDNHYRSTQAISRFFWAAFYTRETLNYYQRRPAKCSSLWVPYADVDQIAGFSMEMEQRARAERSTFFEGAKSALRLCNYLVLPLILGGLGSLAYVIRNILDGFAKSSLTISSNRRGSMRIYLGALLGLISGVIISPDLAEMQKIRYSPLVWAFLMGYSVEFAFSLFDTLITRGRNALNALKNAQTDLKKEADEPH